MTSELAERRIGFIGCGAMARALAGGLLASGVSTERLRGADPDAGQRQAFGADLGVRVHADNAALVESSQVVVLAVKPAVVPDVLAALGGTAGLEDRLWISIAAGVSLATLARALPQGARLVRAMPNTPAQVRAGATGLCANPAARSGDLALAEALFNAVGTTWLAPEEALLDAVTGLSGSGPAFVFVMLEALSEAGVRVGLPRQAALDLARQTVYGAAKLALESGTDPATLKQRVSSPGGTTVAGLEKLEAGGIRAALGAAVAAATARARELGG